MNSKDIYIKSTSITLEHQVLHIIRNGFVFVKSLPFLWNSAVPISNIPTKIYLDNKTCDFRIRKPFETFKIYDLDI